MPIDYLTRNIDELPVAPPRAPLPEWYLNSIPAVDPSKPLPKSQKGERYSPHGLPCTCAPHTPPYWWTARGRHSHEFDSVRTEVCRCVHCVSRCPA